MCPVRRSAPHDVQIAEAGPRPAAQFQQKAVPTPRMQPHAVQKDAFVPSSCPQLLQCIVGRSNPNYRFELKLEPRNAAMIAAQAKNASKPIAKLRIQMITPQRAHAP